MRPAAVARSILRARVEACSYMDNANGAMPPAWWHSTQLAASIGAMSRV